MTKFFLGLLSGVLLVFLLGFVFLLVLVMLAASGGGGVPTVADNSVLQLDLSGPVLEHRAADFSIEWLESGPPPTLLGMRQAILAAADDDDVSALELNCGGLSVGWAKAQEIRGAITKFSESGKPVIARIQVGGMLDYYVASAADEVYLFPEGMLDAKGLRAEVSFYKDTLDKIGAEVEAERIGKYKNAPETYTETGMSDAFREVIDSMLDEMLKQYLETVAPSRYMSPEQLRAALDEGPFLPNQAEELGIIDGLLYDDQFEDRVLELTGADEYETVSLSSYVAAHADTLLGESGDPQIAVLYGVGNIMRGKTQTDPFSGAVVLGSDSFSKALEDLAENDDVEAVILRIDSPGGDAIASDQMWRGLARLREKKPVVVSMSDVAASGGYYMAMAEDTPVVAYPGTVTGSIGVFFGKVNLEGLYEKLGVHTEILTRGRFAAIDTSSRALTEAERIKLREGVEQFYQTFVQKVADARDATWEEIHQVAQGRVWTGTQALDQNLVDQLGGYAEVIALAKLQAEIDADTDVRLVAYPAPKPWFESLIEQGSMVRAPSLLDLAPEKLKTPALPSLLRGGMLAVSPYAVEIR